MCDTSSLQTFKHKFMNMAHVPTFEISSSIEKRNKTENITFEKEKVDKHS